MLLLVSLGLAAHIPPCIWGKSSLLPCQKIGVGLPEVQGEKRPFPFTMQPDLVSCLFLEVLYCDLSWPHVTGHVKFESKPKELLNWMVEEVLDRILGLGCQAAHYNADSIASAPPNKCKEQENCSFLPVLLLSLRHWQALRICHLLTFLQWRDIVHVACSEWVKLFSEFKVVHIRLFIKLSENYPCCLCSSQEVWWEGSQYKVSDLQEPKLGHPLRFLQP